MESHYIGGAGEDVQWSLEEVETLDMLGDVITDGREVYAESIDATVNYVRTTDGPDTSRPMQSGV